MKSNPQVIETLNDILTAELTAINQYFLHSRMDMNWGYHRLGKKVREESIGEMRHAEVLVERILYLEGLPNVQRLGNVKVGENVLEQLRLDLESERGSVQGLNDGIKTCREAGDNGSRKLLEEMLREAEEHVEWLESQLTLINQVGEANYLAQQIREDD